MENLIFIAIASRTNNHIIADIIETQTLVSGFTSAAVENNQVLDAFFSVCNMVLPLRLETSH